MVDFHVDQLEQGDSRKKPEQSSHDLNQKVTWKHEFTDDGIPCKQSQQSQIKHSTLWPQSAESETEQKRLDGLSGRLRPEQRGKPSKTAAKTWIRRPQPVCRQTVGGNRSVRRHPPEFANDCALLIAQCPTARPVCLLRQNLKKIALQPGREMANQTVSKQRTVAFFSDPTYILHFSETNPANNQLSASRPKTLLISSLLLYPHRTPGTTMDAVEWL
jgi:hypothetical protein